MFSWIATPTEMLYFCFSYLRCSQIPAIFSVTSALSTWVHVHTRVLNVARPSPPRQASSSTSTSTAVSNPLSVSQIRVLKYGDVCLNVPCYTPAVHHQLFHLQYLSLCVYLWDVIERQRFWICLCVAVDVVFTVRDSVKMGLTRPWWAVSFCSPRWGLPQILHPVLQPLPAQAYARWLPHPDQV